MSEDIVISVENVSKAYRIWDSPSARLTSPIQASLAGLLPPKSSPAQWLSDRAAASYRDFYALQNVSFTIKRGQSVGIVGRNGSGKSTLLQVIAGTLQPTTGSYQVKGRVAALLELGCGFNPEFSGRDNVYLNSAVHGLSRDDVDKRFQSIEDFAEIGDFMEQPVKTYSSGMMMRLAFACIVNVEPDILIVDEALAVGDMRFQRKCKEWIASLTQRGVTFLFVSHSPAEVAQLTSNAILLDGGKLLRMGPSREVVVDYQRLLFGEEIESAVPDTTVSTQSLPALSPDSTARTEFDPTQIVAKYDEADQAALIKSAVTALSSTTPTTSPIELRHGNRLVEIIDFGITNERGTLASVLLSGNSYLFYFRGVALSDFNQMFAAFAIRNVNGVELFFTNTELQKVSMGKVARGDLVQATSQVRMWLAPGDYFLSAVTRDGDTNEALDRRLDAFHFQVTSEEKKIGGLVNLQPNFTFRIIGNVAK